jgi:hypothetical protein
MVMFILYHILARRLKAPDYSGVVSRHALVDSSYYKILFADFDRSVAPLNNFLRGGQFIVE